MTKYVISLLVAFILMGCADVSTRMKSADGRTMNCHASGFGLIGAPAALLMRDNCVSDAKEKGFVPSTEAVNQSSVDASSIKYEGKVKFSPPNGWVKKPPPAVYSKVIDFETNATLDAYVLVSYENNITDIKQFAESRKSSQLSKLQEGSSTQIVESNFMGHNSFVVDIEGVFTNTGARYHFRNTVIDAGGNDIIMLSTWTTATNYSGNVKKQLDEMTNGLSGI